MSKRWFARLLFVLVLIGLSVAFLAQIQANAVPRFEHLDKVVHFVAFFILAWTFHRAFPIPWWLAVLILTGYGLAIEYIQGLMPYRSSSGWDLVADAAGAATYYKWALWRHHRNKAKRKSEATD
ncbi:hypothetical protein CWE22_10445 [Pseudidiomarina aestuarii]|uniref:VanZ-like domain-containing protein n=1 Tax=Pseudidiomarina aestuarii TaxID=624146 RepID=A0A7Z6ZS08_9GAMM|nr:VanZ family protein [Pseudidiomarina aestuarii]RUO39168.1 hypothetical protein CWE22_10445 [Pseudidiomarina aestuarii]